MSNVNALSANANLVQAALNNAKTSDALGVAVIAKANDLQKQQGQSIIDLIDSPVQKVNFKA